jgi:hypothetical protein
MRKIFFILFLCSFSSLGYEITLTRIFSISLSHHFAFMIISIAMLGIGGSGTLLSLCPKLRNPSFIGIYSGLVGFGISASYLLSNQIRFDPVKLQWSQMQLFSIIGYYLLLSLPFLLTGLTIAAAFSSFSTESGLLYGADLLGAGMGAIGVLSLMTVIGPHQVVFVLSTIALFASLPALTKKFKLVSFILILINLSILILHPSFSDPWMSPYKGLQVGLKVPGAEHLKTYDSPFSRIDLFKSPAVRFAPGLSLRYLERLPQQIGFSIDGGELNAVTAAADRKSLDFLHYLPSALPYALGRNEKILIMDPKGGLQVLVAKSYHAKKIDKIESNPLLIKIIEKDLKEFSGGLYSADIASGLGRWWLRSKGKAYDLIDLSLMGTIPSGSFGISEDYRFTVEAFKEYFHSLKPEGLLSLNLFIVPPPRIELRLLQTMITALEESGVKEAEKQIAAIRSWGTICLLLKKSPLTAGEIEAIKRFATDRRFDLIHTPGILEAETNIYIRMASNEYFDTFQKILSPETRENFIRDYLFNIRPVRDDTPFFHYYLKLGKTKEIYDAMGKKWQFFIEEGYLLPAIFLQVLFLSFALILLPAVVRRRTKVKSRVEVSRKDSLDLNLSLNLDLLSLSYFAFLGLGFMFVEVPLIQKMILSLENPSYAVAIVLTAVLISSGAGSLLSHRVFGLKKIPVPLVLSILILIYSLVFPSFSKLISPFSMALKILSVFLFLLPLGLLMGVPFPTGLKRLGKKDPSLVPWAWAINGCLSVLAPLLAAMLAMTTGFMVVLWAGSGAYLLAFLTSFSLPRQSSEQRPRTPSDRGGAPPDASWQG